MMANLRVLSCFCVFAMVLTGCGGNTQMESSTGPQSAPWHAAPASTSFQITGLRKNYSISKTPQAFVVTNLLTKSTTSVPISAVSIRFTDMTVNLLVGEKSLTIPDAKLKSLVELYIAFFNRVPDADGMAYWIDQIKAGMTVDQLADNFYSAAIQYSSVTGYSSTMTNAEFVRLIYKNVLGRTGATSPPEADVAYWADDIASGRSTKGRLIVTMLAAARTFVGDANYGWVPQLLDNKVEVGRYFSIQQGLNFNTPSDSITNGMLIAGDITANSTASALARIGFVDRALDLTASLIKTKAEGVYEGITSAGAAFNLLVLEDQSYWVLYGLQDKLGQLTVYGFIQGNATSTDTSFNSNNGRDYYYDGQVTTALMTTNYIAGKRLSGTINDGGQTGVFNAIVPTTGYYDYNLPAKLSDIVGTWFLTSYQGGSVSVLISQSGDMIGTATGSSCTFSGKLTPRASRKNVFNLSLVEGPGCGLAGQTVTGIAITYKNSVGKQEFLVAGVTANRLLGDAYFGDR